MEKIPYSDYKLVNSFLNNPYELAEKYEIISPSFSKDFEELDDQLN